MPWTFFLHIKYNKMKGADNAFTAWRPLNSVVLSQIYLKNCFLMFHTRQIFNYLYFPPPTPYPHLWNSWHCYCKVCEVLLQLNVNWEKIYMPVFKTNLKFFRVGMLNSHSFNHLCAEPLLKLLYLSHRECLNSWQHLPCVSC